MLNEIQARRRCSSAGLTQLRNQDPSMAAPLMPKATAVWLVENTSLTFEQIADFCELHPLEIQAIADGEVANQMQGLDPVANGQTTTEEIARCQADPEARLKLSPQALPPQLVKHADRQTPGQAGRDRFSAEEPSRALRCPDLKADRHDQTNDRCGARPHALEQLQHQAAAPGRARAVHVRGVGASCQPHARQKAGGGRRARQRRGGATGVLNSRSSTPKHSEARGSPQSVINTWI